MCSVRCSQAGFPYHWNFPYVKNNRMEVNAWRLFLSPAWESWIMRELIIAADTFTSSPIHHRCPRWAFPIITAINISTGHILVKMNSLFLIIQVACLDQARLGVHSVWHRHCRQRGFQNETTATSVELGGSQRLCALAHRTAAGQNIRPQKPDTAKQWSLLMEQELVIPLKTPLSMKRMSFLQFPEFAYIHIIIL